MGVTASALRARRGTFVLEVPTFRADARGTAVLGPNGAGKTTLLQALQRLIPIDGSVAVPPSTAGVFAQPAVLRGSALWNVAVPVRTAHGVAAAEAEARAAELLDAVGLAAFARSDARTLSTGQRQRLALARALALRPQALFLDEPFANVDVDARPALRALLRAYLEAAGCDLVLVTASLADASALCGDAVVLEAGRLAYQGTVAGLRAANDRFVKALIGEFDAFAAG